MPPYIILFYKQGLSLQNCVSNNTENQYTDKCGLYIHMSSQGLISFME